jgi:BMFP domain-containing protein YqiC
MEMLPSKETMGYLNNFGAMALLALMVYRSPQIVAAIGALIEKTIGHIREAQKEALTAFKGEMQSMLVVFKERFEAIETHLVSNGSKLNDIDHRVGKLEYVHQSTSD